MNDARRQAQQQLRGELREIGLWPNRQEVEPYRTEEAQARIKQRISAALEALEPTELVVVERIVSMLRPKG